MKELADSLEITDPISEDHPNAGYEVLKSWSEEMKEYTSNLRIHLSYHLIMVGINDIAKRLACRFEKKKKNNI